MTGYSLGWNPSEISGSLFEQERVTFFFYCDYGCQPLAKPFFQSWARTRKTAECFDALNCDGKSHSRIL
jgi:hypothetical protein